MTGYLGWVDFMLSSTGISEVISKSFGNSTVTENTFPGFSAFTATSTPFALTEGSDNTSMLVPKFCTCSVFVIEVDSGPGGKLICPGMSVIAGCTFAMAVTTTSGVVVEDVFMVICELTFPGWSGGFTLMSRSKLLPGSLVLSCAEKAGFWHC